MRVSLVGLPALFRLPAAALDIAAKALRVLADVNEHLATSLAADDTAGGRDAAEQTRPQPQVQPPRVADVAPPATAEAFAAAPDLESLDIAALAAQTAPRVLEALDTLSTEDLAELYEHESTHRRRATVLRGIEAAAAPPVDARVDDLLLDDVRQPDELVYTTATPTR